ncbi:hypothetical protein K502DRAFT_368729 [Neoconidiobolus thromboides FSU 785]|nr:hypothetical protein K502DRAFT_368729 [Neoconidiobolus thromboides FSU 785]
MTQKINRSNDNNKHNKNKDKNENTFKYPIIHTLPIHPDGDYMWLIYEVIKDLKKYVTLLFYQYHLNKNSRKRKQVKSQQKYINTKTNIYQSCIIYQQLRLGKCKIELKYQGEGIKFRVKEKTTMRFFYHFGNFGKLSYFFKKEPRLIQDNEEYNLDLLEVYFLKKGFEDKIQIKDNIGVTWTSTMLFHLGYKLYSDKFVNEYLVYHYFRSNGWVVKNGLKFATNFVLYKDGPTYQHSKYAVIIKSINNINDIILSWKDLIQYTRLASQIKKVSK